MLPLLVLLVATQVPAVPGEGTLVSFCKQGRLAACQELAKLHPQQAAKIQAELAKAALSQEALRVSEEEAREEEDSKDAEKEASDEPPNCNGQNHHIISKRIAEALKEHETLGGLYEPRDKRFVAKAKDTEAHCGYQDWHRKVDAEIIQWLTDNRKATAEQFMKMLRELYSRPDMLKRFPNGF